MNNDIWNETALEKKRFVPYAALSADHIMLIMTECRAPFDMRHTLDPDEAFRILAEVTGRVDMYAALRKQIVVDARGTAAYGRILQYIADLEGKTVVDMWSEVAEKLRDGRLKSIAELEAEHAEKLKKGESK